MAQATLGESDQPVETHYFVLSADSRLFGIYRNVERPRWAWFFAV